MAQTKTKGNTQTNPHGTGFPFASIIVKRESSEGIDSRAQSLCPHTPRGQSFFLLLQAEVATWDPMLSPDLRPKSAFKLTRTAQPPASLSRRSKGKRRTLTRHSVRWPRTQLHPLGPSEACRSGPPAATDYDDIAKKNNT